MCPLRKPPSTQSSCQPTNRDENVKKQISHFIRKSTQNGIRLTELPAIANNSATTKIRSTRNVLLGIFILSATLLIPWFCMEFDDCHLNFPAVWSNAFRPPVTCDFCRGIVEVRRIANVQPDEFERNFAYSSVPVVVTDATVNWTAMEVNYGIDYKVLL